MSWQDDVIRFHKMSGLFVGEKPALPPEAEFDTAIMLIDEEVTELIEAYDNGDLVSCADALGDILYVVLGAAARFGIDMNDIWNEIQRSNMTKSGGAINPATGKFEKPESYSPPRIRQVLEWQGWDGS